jgi:hypothetical protein
MPTNTLKNAESSLKARAELEIQKNKLTLGMTVERSPIPGPDRAHRWGHRIGSFLEQLAVVVILRSESPSRLARRKNPLLSSKSRSFPAVEDEVQERLLRLQPHVRVLTSRQTPEMVQLTVALRFVGGDGGLLTLVLLN